MFEEFLQHEKHRLNLPGMAVAINEDSREVYSCGVGYCDPGTMEPVTPDSLFGVASITKLLTTIEIMRLAEQGLLCLEDPVAQHIPGLQVSHAAPMQLQHFLSHSAGFPGLDTRFRAAELTQTVSETGRKSTAEVACPNQAAHTFSQIVTANQLVDYINSLDLRLIAPPGELLNYSNEGFCLLGGLIEKLRSSTYSNAINNGILQPLKLTRSVIGGSTLATMDNVAQPLLRDGVDFKRGQVWNAPLFYPAGGLVASARDLTKLIRAVFCDNRLLSSCSHSLLASSVMPVSSRPYAQAGYGYGLEYRKIDAGNTVMWHTGQRPGISSFMAWHLEQKVAVSVLSHIADAPVAGIGFKLLGMLLGRDDFAWPPSDRSASVVTSVSNDGRYTSAEGFDYQVKSTSAECKLYTNYSAGSKHEQDAPDFYFVNASSGTVGTQTFQFLPPDPMWADAGALAIDLRVLPRAE